MKITYTLTKDDILQMQLFMASISEQVRKARRKTHLRVPILYLVLAIVFMICTDWIVGILFIGVAIVWYFAYPAYQAKQYVKYYARHVDENLAKRTESPTEVIFDDEYITATDYSGESKLKINVIERMDEVRDYCFLKLNSGSGIVIPLGQLQNREDLISLLKNMASTHGIAYHTNKEWKWR